MKTETITMHNVTESKKLKKCYYADIAYKQAMQDILSLVLIGDWSCQSSLGYWETQILFELVRYPGPGDFLACEEVSTVKH